MFFMNLYVRFCVKFEMGVVVMRLKFWVKCEVERFIVVMRLEGVCVLRSGSSLEVDGVVKW